VESYKAKADIAIAESVIPEDEFVSRVYKKFGLHLGESSKQKIKSRVKARKAGSLRKRHPDVKAKRAERKIAFSATARLGLNKTTFYKDPKKAEGRDHCGCEGFLFFFFFWFVLKKEPNTK